MTRVVGPGQGPGAAGPPPAAADALTPDRPVDSLLPSPFRPFARARAFGVRTVKESAMPPHHSSTSRGGNEPAIRGRA